MLSEVSSAVVPKIPPTISSYHHAPCNRILCASSSFEDCEQANDATCILPMEDDVENVLRSQKPGNRFDKRETRGETSIGRAF